MTVHPATLDRRPGGGRPRRRGAHGPRPGHLRRHAAEHGPGRHARSAQLCARPPWRPGRVAVEALGERALLGPAPDRRRDARQQLERPRRGAGRWACPAVNVGDRQAGRHREANVLDVAGGRRGRRRGPRACARPRRSAPAIAPPDPRSPTVGPGERIAHIIAAWQPPEPAPQAARSGSTRDAGRWSSIGGGEHARVVVEAADAPRRWTVVGHRRTAADPGDGRLTGSRTSARTTSLAAAAGRGRRRGPAACSSWGSAARPRRAAGPSSASARRPRWATIVHPAAWVSPSADARADGTVVLAGAVVNAGAVDRRPRDRQQRRGRRARRPRRRATSTSPPARSSAAGAGSGTTPSSASAPRPRPRHGRAGATVGMGAVVVADVPGRRCGHRRPARPATVG